MTQGAEAQSADRARYELAELVETARALASERDIKKLLAVILRKCRQVTGADAGSVYVVEEEGGSQAEYKPTPNEVPALHAVAERFDQDRLQGVRPRYRRHLDRRPGGAVQTPDQHPRPVEAGSEPEDEDAASQPQLRRQDRLPRAVDAHGADAVGGRRGDRRRAADQQAPGSRAPARERQRRGRVR